MLTFVVGRQGVSDTFRDADLLAEAVDAGMSGRQPLDAALAGHEQTRNEAIMPMCEFTYALAGLEPPPPPMQRLFGALHGNQAGTDRFVGLLAGTVSIPAFFAPADIERIVGAAPAVAA